MRRILRSVLEVPIVLVMLIGLAIVAASSWAMSKAGKS